MVDQPVSMEAKPSRWKRGEEIDGLVTNSPGGGMGMRYRRREQGCLICLRRARRGGESCLRCVSDTGSGDEQTRVRVAGGRAARTQPSSTILPATHGNSSQARRRKANLIKSMMRRPAETSDRVYASIEGDMQAPKRAPPTHPQRTQKQSSMTRRSLSVVQRSAETSKKSTCRRQTCKYPTEHHLLDTSPEVAMQAPAFEHGNL